MGPLDALNHIANLLLPGVALGCLAAALAKLMWRRELHPIAWVRLAWPSALACAVVAVAGLLLFGHDGRMATYAAMVLACAVMLWWRGFGPGRH
ncbi:MAG: hypothetical protein ABIN96_16970 [Rubrivivax sp.]